MGITHVIRGEDHISNTPKQILIAEALGISSPLFAHMPLILGLDRSKLSKRNGSTPISQYRELGYTPKALVSAMALLGWSPNGTSENEEQVFTLSEIQKYFSI